MQQTRVSRGGLTERFHLQFMVLMLLTIYTTSGIAAQLPSQRFFYAASTSSAASSTLPQTKVRLLRETTGKIEDKSVLTVVINDEAICCQGAPSAGGESVTLPLELSSEFSNVTADYSEVDGSGESTPKDHFKRSVSRSIRTATAASCSPQPTIVELKPLPDSDGDSQTASNVYYTPACTRINRCNGCCGSTLISCQPTQTEIVQLRVRKLERSTTGSKSGWAIVAVEQHLSCKCDCRIKADDCNVSQHYRKDLCRCECQNTDARDKCLEQADHKYWDDANCTCACRFNQSCTTGTIFDETQCKCTDPSFAAAGTSQFMDRKRFIVQAVAVETDNSTLYSV